MVTHPQSLFVLLTRHDDPLQIMVHSIARRILFYSYFLKKFHKNVCKNIRNKTQLSRKKLLSQTKILQVRKNVQVIIVDVS